MMQNRNWSYGVRLMAMIVLALALIAVIYIARGSMTLIFGAVIIAYILSPIANFFVKRLRFKRSLAVMVAYLLLIVIVVVIFSFIIPFITSRIQGFLSTDWPTVFSRVDTWLESMIQETEVKQFSIGNIGINLSVPLVELRKSLNSINFSNVNVSSLAPNFSEIMQSFLSVSANVISRIFGILIAILTTIMASIHFCNDGWKVKSIVIEQFSEPYRAELNELFARLGRVWSNYFAGELKLMLIIGVTTFAVCSGLGLKWAFTLGVIAGFFEVVPNIGPILSCIPAIFSAAIFGSTWLPLNNFLMVIVVIAAYILIQQLENILIVPRVMGNALDLHPVLIILGILVLSSRLGVLGALLAAPLIGLIKVVLNFVLCKIRGEDPYPEIYLAQK